MSVRVEWFTTNHPGFAVEMLEAHEVDPDIEEGQPGSREPVLAISADEVTAVYGDLVKFAELVREGVQGSVTTVEDLDELPSGTVLLHEAEPFGQNVYERYMEYWFTTGSERFYDSHELKDQLPMKVLYRPDRSVGGQ